MTHRLHEGKGQHAGSGKTRLSIVCTRLLPDTAAQEFWVARLLGEFSRWVSRSPARQLQAALFVDEADLYLPATRKPATGEAGPWARQRVHVPEVADDVIEAGLCPAPRDSHHLAGGLSSEIYWVARQKANRRAEMWSGETETDHTYYAEQRDRVRRKLLLLRAYLSKHPVAGLKRSVVYRAVPLGAFAASCRYRFQQGDLSTWLTSELEAIPGWTWKAAPRSQDGATPNVKRLRAYVEAHGWTGIRHSTVIDGSPIGAWISYRRREYKTGRLSKNLQAALDRIPGWTWEVKRDTFPNVARLRAYVEANGWDTINGSTVLDGHPIGRWIMNVRAQYRKGSLTQGLAAALNSIPGWSWGTTRRHHLRRVLTGIRRFVNLHGWSAITKDTVIEGVQADLWLSTRRSAYRKGRLAPWLVSELEVIGGWSWKATPGRYHYRDMTALLAEYVAVHGWAGLQWDTTFRSARIGGFVHESILRHREGRLPSSTRRALEKIPGWRWDRDVAAPADQRLLAKLNTHVKTDGWSRIREWTKFQETRLGRWLRFCRSRKTRNKLPETLRSALERLPGWTWDFRQVRGRDKGGLR